MYWPGWWRDIELAQGHVAGSIFSFFCCFFRWKNWASYEALRQLRGAEPATKHWASYVSLSQQGSFELARRQWASKVALSFIIYIPMQSQPYNILNLGQNIFFWGRHVPLSWSGNVKSYIRYRWFTYSKMWFSMALLNNQMVYVTSIKPPGLWNDQMYTRIEPVTLVQTRLMWCNSSLLYIHIWSYVYNYVYRLVTYLYTLYTSSYTYIYLYMALFTSIYL